MKFGLNEAQWKIVEEKLILPLKQKGAELWCFGSRARGEHKKFSDLDIMIDSSLDLSSDIGSIKEYFENSNFPFKIDIVQKKHFAKSYIQNFEREKVQL